MTKIGNSQIDRSYQSPQQDCFFYAGTGICTHDLPINAEFLCQVAIVSGGMGECGDQDKPGIYVRVDHPLVLGFIKAMTKIPMQIEGETLSPCLRPDSNLHECAICPTIALKLKD